MNQPFSVKIALHFFPCCQYLTKVLASSLLILDDESPFEKQSYQNRAYICGANKVQRLSVPLEQGKTRKPFRDVKIDYTDNWARKTWTAIASAYGKTPYFPFYAKEVEKLLKSRYRFLIDLNQATLNLLARGLDLNFQYEWLSCYNDDESKAMDIRSLIHPKKPFSSDSNFKPVAYPQAFTERFGFIENLSGLDLLFNEGPEGRDTLKQCLAHLYSSR